MAQDRKAEVYNGGALAGVLEKTTTGTYIFSYDSTYLSNPEAASISLTLPKSVKRFESNNLFPFFFGLLSEGENKRIQCRMLRIDENDSFSLLLQTASADTIGAITIREIKP